MMPADLLTLFHEGYFSAMDYYLAVGLGRLSGEKDPLVLLTIAALSRLTSEGHVCLDVNYLAGRRISPITEGTAIDAFWPDKGSWIAALNNSPLVSYQQSTVPMVLDRVGRLYLARYWDYQERLVKKLLDRAQQKILSIDENLLNEGLQRLFPSNLPNGEENMQRRAAEISVRKKLSIISGGPGTGKTTTVLRILALIIDQEKSQGTKTPRIGMAAPTGKAAARMSEAISYLKTNDQELKNPAIQKLLNHIPDSAMTVHRLLGAGGTDTNSYRFDRSRRLPVDVLIVDETSMIDLPMMTRILEAIPDNSRLILIGDKDQLSSVESGAILRDICGRVSENEFPTVGVEMPRNQKAIALSESIVHLTHSFRFAADSGIGRLSQSINEGDPDRLMACLLNPLMPEISFIQITDPEELPEKLVPLVEAKIHPLVEEVDPMQRLEKLSRFRILCSHRKGPFGIEAINRTISEKLIRGSSLKVNGEWFDGRPVMITENNYQMGLFNGDVGIISKNLESADKLVAVFPGYTEEQLKYFSPYQLPAHETAFAMTIHKSQGAEFDEILIILPPFQSPILTRELLYTAVTRAKKNITIFGSEILLRQAVKTPIQRASGISDLLWNESVSATSPHDSK